MATDHLRTKGSRDATRSPAAYESPLTMRRSPRALAASPFATPRFPFWNFGVEFSKARFTAALVAALLMVLAGAAVIGWAMAHFR